MTQLMDDDKYVQMEEGILGVKDGLKQLTRDNNRLTLEDRQDIIKLVNEFSDNTFDRSRDNAPSYWNEISKWLNKVKQTLSDSNIKNNLSTAGRKIVDGILKIVNSLIKLFTKAKSQRQETVESKQVNTRPLGRSLRSTRNFIESYRRRMRDTAPYRQGPKLKKRVAALSAKGLEDAKGLQKEHEVRKDVNDPRKVVVWADEQQAVTKIQRAFRKHEAKKVVGKHSAAVIEQEQQHTIVAPAPKQASDLSYRKTQGRKPLGASRSSTYRR